MRKVQKADGAPEGDVQRLIIVSSGAEERKKKRKKRGVEIERRELTGPLQPTAHLCLKQA